MSDLQAVPSRADIERLQQAISRLPQAKLETRHHFAGGVYLREMHCPPDCTIVGKVHKSQHFFVLAVGEMTLTGDGLPPRRIKAPAVIVSSPGVKRAGYSHTACVCFNIHRTDNVDLDAIEIELIEPDESALFDARNELKASQLEGSTP